MKRQDIAAPPVSTAAARVSSEERAEIRPRLVALGLALLCLLVYLPVGQHQFLSFDDPLYITENKQVQAGLTWPGVQWAFRDLHASMWHPVTWLSHMLDCQIFGLDPAAHHLLNALWHATNAALLLLVFYRLTRSLWPSALAAALFAVHPLRVESVAWASERKDVLSTFFFLLMLLLYFKFVEAGSSNGREVPAPTPSSKHGGKGHGKTLAKASATATPSCGASSSGRTWLCFGLALVAFALGLMSKAMLVTAPFVLLLLDIWPLQRVRWISWQKPAPGVGRLIWEKVPFFVLAGAVVAMTLKAQRPEDLVPTAAYPMSLRACYAMVAFGQYLLKTIWPADLAILYPVSRQLPWLRFGFSVLAFVGISILCWRQRRTRPHLLVGWLWFIGTLVPVIGLVQAGGQFAADRYTYLPHIGLCLALAFELQRWLRPQAAVRGDPSQPGWHNLTQAQRIGAAAGLAVVALCIGVTEHQLSYWADGRTLFAHAIAVTGDNPFAHLNLAIALDRAGQRDAARREYETTLRLDPGSPEAHANLGDLLNETGDTQAALSHYQESLRFEDQARVRENLGALLAKLGRFDEATSNYDAAARLAPEDSRPYYLRGKLLLRHARSREAVEQFHQALARDPNDLPSLVFLARVLAADPDVQVRNGPQAVGLAERANALSGSSQSFVLDTLAMAYAEAGRFSDATQTQQLACDRASEAGDKDALAGLQAQLELYRAHKPYREQFESNPH